MSASIAKVSIGHWLCQFLCSSLGRKYVMALTGVGLSLFVVGHLSGNLLLFCGQDAFNTYAATLKGMGALLWVARGGLLVTFVVHIITAASLTMENREARPVAYHRSESIVTCPAAKTMIFSGAVVTVFVAYHLAHFTLFFTNPEFAELRDALGRHDAFTMTVLGFQSLPVSVAYILAMLCLGLHLSHGLKSLFQSLGLRHRQLTPLIEKGGPALALLLVLGFISIPIAVLLGVIALPPGVAG